jgi:hypothetical protein
VKCMNNATLNSRTCELFVDKERNHRLPLQRFHQPGKQLLRRSKEPQPNEVKKSTKYIRRFFKFLKISLK